MSTVRANRAVVSKLARYTGLGVMLAMTAALSDPASAQQIPAGVLAVGNAAVSGFSGAPPPAQIPPGVDPGEKTFIDPDGPSLRIVDLQHVGGPPAAQLVAAAKPVTWFAAQIGQVFAVALDSANPPNIYAAATSAYGLPITAAKFGGEVVHVRNGAPHATFMAGLWGKAAAGGGPGSIWKIDGITGAVSLFADVKLGGRANSGPALGGLAFDPDTHSLYVADRETGFIHRFGLDGSERDRFDHGTAGRHAQGLSPLAFDPTTALDITSAKFDSTDPATWNYAAPERRVFGLAIYQHRLYYAVAAGLQIWSVGLGADGAFGNDATLEVVVPPGAGPTEISKIAFDEQNRMVLAERPAPTGAFDFEALTPTGLGRVLRYANIGAAPNAEVNWQPVPDEYAIGFPLPLRNGDGGIAIGYLYNPKGDIDLQNCGGYLWSTGEQLRKSAEVGLAERLRQSGPENVDGLQGNGTWRIRRGDEPPLASYFIDYDDRFDDDPARGHIGDVAIARVCAAEQRAALLPRPWETPQLPPGASLPLPPPGATPPLPPPQPPPGGCVPGQVQQGRIGACPCGRPNVLVNGQCCSPQDLAPGGKCASPNCQAGTTPIGPSNFCCNNNQVYKGASGSQMCCLSGKLSNGQCQSQPKCLTGAGGLQCCAGYTPTGSGFCCLASQMTSTGICCPNGQTPSGPNKSQCKEIVIIPVKIKPLCCSAGQTPTRNVTCCPVANVTSTGFCCNVAITTPDRTSCPATTQVIIKGCAAGYTRMPDGSCCNNRNVSADGKSCQLSRQPCAAGEFRDLSGVCLPIPSASCPPGEFLDASGACLPTPSPGCQSGWERNRQGSCVAVPSGACPSGEIRDREGTCLPRPPAGCPPGLVQIGNGACMPKRSTACPPGEIRGRNGSCIQVGAPPPRPVFRGRPPVRIPPRAFFPRRPRR